MTATGILVLVLLTAAAGYLLACRAQLWLAKVAVFAAAGLALGPAGLGIVRPTLGGWFGTAAGLIVAAFALALGSRIGSVTWGRELGRQLVPELARWAMVVTVGTGVFLAAGFSPATAVVVAAAISTLRGHGLGGSSGILAPGGWPQVAADARTLAALAVVAVTLSVAAPGRSLSDGAARIAFELVVFPCLAGAAAGWALGRFAPAAQERDRLMLVTCVVALLLGLASVVGATGMVSAAAAGAVAARLGADDAVLATLRPLEEIGFLALFVIGAASVPAITLHLLVGVGLAVGVRGLAAWEQSRSHAEGRLRAAASALSPAPLAVGFVAIAVLHPPWFDDPTRRGVPAGTVILAVLLLEAARHVLHQRASQPDAGEREVALVAADGDLTPAQRAASVELAADLGARLVVVERHVVDPEDEPAQVVGDELGATDAGVGVDRVVSGAGTAPAAAVQALHGRRLELVLVPVASHADSQRERERWAAVATRLQTPVALLDPDSMPSQAADLDTVPGKAPTD